jgi:lipopolysaccharide/colanic/teichoic acid biosynthesis glycosyltransferase/GGDEF domain-containing protein
MEKLDIFDTDTGCYCEEYFIHRLREEKRRAERTEAPLAMVIFDFSAYVKMFNGGSKISRVGEYITNNTREIDIKAHISGNKIVILMPETSPDKAALVGKKLKNCLQTLLHEHHPRQHIALPYRIETYPDLKTPVARENQLSFEPAQHTAAKQPSQNYFKMSWPSNNALAADVMDEIHILSDIKEKVTQIQWQLIIKRLIDFFGAAIGLLILSPIILLISLAIKLSTPGPVLFRQERLGYMGKKFMFLKFRSMQHKCDDSIHKEYMAKFINKQNEKHRDKSGTVSFHKMTDDPRITPLGRMLRKTSLDELPQLYNVLRGEMSLVGPRPPIAYEVDRYSSWHKRRILEVKPGITGLWQVEGRSTLSFDEAVRLDIHYAENWNLLLDLKLILKTFKVVFSGKGAY